METLLSIQYLFGGWLEWQLKSWRERFENPGGFRGHLDVRPDGVPELPIFALNGFWIWGSKLSTVFSLWDFDFGMTSGWGRQRVLSAETWGSDLHPFGVVSETGRTATKPS